MTFLSAGFLEASAGRREKVRVLFEFFAGGGVRSEKGHLDSPQVLLSCAT